MKERNLPIKLVMQKSEDTKSNEPGGSLKFFGEVTSDLQNSTIEKFNNLLDYYSDVFNESEFVPAVGRIRVKSEAIAKSHKPNELCKKCSIIGANDLGEIYIKVTADSINKTIRMIRNLPSKKFEANLTAVDDISPIFPDEKITSNLSQVVEQESFNRIKNKIKLKLFDFDNEFDNSQIMGYVARKLSDLGFDGKYKIIKYGENIQYIKITVDSYDDVVSIAGINGVKSVDFFQEYSQPLTLMRESEIKSVIEGEISDSDVTIGIIDGGISDENPFLKPYIVDREVYINEAYQNPKHATFIASTIQFGDELNNIPTNNHNRYKFVDIIAIPNSDPKYGPTDSINEEELMEIIEDCMNKYAKSVKIWNLSLGIESEVCDGNMSDLGKFLDYIQDEYNVQIFVSSGNLNTTPLREWPPQDGIGDRDRIISPADSVRAITVGSIALYDSDDSIVKRDQPSPFSRRGPGANYIVKPEVVDYGGNISKFYTIDGLGMKGMNSKGEIVEGNGTSYSTPRIARKFASVYEEMLDKDLLLAKALLIHSARMNSRDSLNTDIRSIDYYGYGMPANNVGDILLCSEEEVTLVFKQKVVQGTHLEMMDFPFPKSLIKNGKYYGEIGMTLVYNPVLDNNYGKEYCRVNVDASFGVYKYDNGKISFKGQVPLERTWNERYESERVENGFKWSPIKSYYRKIKVGLKEEEGWKIRIDMTSRNEITVPFQEFVLIVTIRDPDGNDIYSEVVNGLRERGYITNNLETRQQLRERN